MAAPEPLETRVGPRTFKVAECLHRLSLPTGYAVGDVNAYLYDDNGRTVLFDTGLGTEESLHALGESLEPIGKKISDIGLLLLTHAHVDHCGAAGAISRISGCGVFVHESELPRVRDFRSASLRELEAMRPQMAAMGFDETVGNRALAVLEKMTAAVTPCPSAERLPADLSSLLPGALWTHVSGHSVADVLFLVPGDDLTPCAVITGDHVLPSATPSPALAAVDGSEYHAPFFRYRESLLRTAGAMAGHIGCPGHGTAIPDTAAAAMAIVDVQNRRLERVRRIIGTKGRSTVLEITWSLFGTGPRWEILMLAVETAGYLRMLENEGACRFEPIPGGADAIIPTGSGVRPGPAPTRNES